MGMKQTLPTLYKRASTGAIQQWTISVEGATITKVYGQVDGAMQVATDKITEGKNVGRSNETTPAEQALAEAQSQWQRKREKHYHLSIDDARNGVVDSSVIAGGVPPMLAQTYAKQGHKITFPAFAQPKLDGHRLIAVVEDGECTLWSRTQKPITGVPHVARAVEALNLPDGTILDGELYNHDYRDRFEQLTSFIKQATPKPGHEVIQYHVYDVVMPGTFKQRNEWIVTNVVPNDTIVTVDTALVASADELMEMFSEFMLRGYEGLMVRSTRGEYVNKRSYDLQKIKEFDDAEFKIIGIESGRGRMQDRAIFVCATEDGVEFNCKMQGGLDALGGIYMDPDSYIGKTITVKYQGLTANGIPRFPVGLRLREDA